MSNKSLLRNVIDMWLRRRGLNISARSILSSLFFVLSLIGVFTITGIWKTVSIAILAVTVIILFYEFFFELPAKVYSESQNRIAELLPLEQAAKLQKDNPISFLSARFDHLMVEKEPAWLGADVVITSWLPYAISIKKVDVILQLPMDGGKHRYDMQTRIGEHCGSVSSESGSRDLKIRVHHDDDVELSTRLIAYVGECHCEWIPLVEGTVIITTNELKEIRLYIHETSVTVNVIRNVSL